MPKAWSEAATAVLPLAVCFCFWENGLLGEALCRGRSPDLQDTKCLPGGSGSPPLGGAGVYACMALRLRCARTFLKKYLGNT